MTNETPARDAADLSERGRLHVVLATIIIFLCYALAYGVTDGIWKR